MRSWLLWCAEDVLANQVRWLEFLRVLCATPDPPDLVGINGGGRGYRVTAPAVLDAQLVTGRLVRGWMARRRDTHPDVSLNERLLRARIHTRSTTVKLTKTTFA